MPTGFEIFAKIIPDTKELDKLKREGINIKAKTTGVAGGMPTATEERSSPFSFLGSMGDKMKGLFGIGGGAGAGMGEAAGAEGAGAAAGGGVAGGVMMGMGLLEILKKVVGFLAGLEPIQAIMALIGAIMKMFFLPLAMMLFTLLRPILIPLLKLMPAWLKFWRDPIGSLKGLGGMIWEALVKLGKWLVDGFKAYLKLIYITIPTKIIEGIVWLAGVIWDYIKDLPKKIWEVIQGIGKWLGDLPGKIWEYMKGIGIWLAGIPEKIWNYVKGLGSIIWGYMKALPSQIWDYMKGIAEWLNAIPIKIWEKVKGLGAVIWEYMKGMAVWFAELPIKIWDKIKALPKLIWDAIKSGISWINDIGGAIVNAFKGAFTWLTDLGGTIWGAISGLPKAIVDAMTGIGEGIGKGIKGFVSWINPFDDFVITKGGQVLRTSPDDYIFGMKNPSTILQNTPQQRNTEVKVNLTIQGIIDEAMVRNIANRIRYEVERAI